MAKELKVTIRVKTVPHPNPAAAARLIAELVLKNYLPELEDEHKKEPSKI